MTIETIGDLRKYLQAFTDECKFYVRDEGSIDFELVNIKYEISQLHEGQLIFIIRE